MARGRHAGTGRDAPAASQRSRQAGDSGRHSAGRSSRHGSGRTRGGIAPWIIITVIVVVVLAAGAVVAGVAASSGCSGNPRQIQVAASPDQEKVLSGLAQSFTNSGAELDGKCIGASVASVAPSTVISSLGPSWNAARGGPRPQVWAPDSPAWFGQARSNATAAPSVKGNGKVLARSPVVLAMPKPMAQAIGWPDHTPKLQRLMATAAGNKGWGAYGKPDWGDIKLGMPDPAGNTAAATFAAMVAGGRDAHTRNGALTGDSATAVENLQETISRRSSDVSGLVSGLQTADAKGKALSFLSMFPATERDVASYNDTSPRVPLAAVTFPQSTVDLQDCYLTLSASWVNATDRKIASQFLAYVRGSAGTKAYAAADFRTPERKFAVRPSPALGLETTLPGSPQPAPSAQVSTAATAAIRAVGRPQQLLLALDRPASSSASYGDRSALQAGSSAALAVASQLGESSQLGFAEFPNKGSDPAAIDDSLSKVTTGSNGSASGLSDTLSALKPRGEQNLPQSLPFLLQRAVRTATKDRPVTLLVITSSRVPQPARLAARLKGMTNSDHPVKLRLVGYGSQTSAKALNQIAGAVGGTALVAGSPDLLPTVALQAAYLQ